jgi:hypothetical protein
MPNLDFHTETTKKFAALRQIDAAIAHLQRSEFECAITLAAAAENVLPYTEEPHVFRSMKQHPLAEGVDFNETINWLKHNSGSDAKVIFEFEAALVIARAMTKYAAVFKDGPLEWVQFFRWGAERGHWSDMDEWAERRETGTWEGK